MPRQTIARLDFPTVGDFQKQIKDAFNTDGWSQIQKDYARYVKSLEMMKQYLRDKILGLIEEGKKEGVISGPTTFFKWDNIVHCVREERGPKRFPDFQNFLSQYGIEFTFLSETTYYVKVSFLDYKELLDAHKSEMEKIEMENRGLYLQMRIPKRNSKGEEIDDDDDDEGETK